MSTKEPKKLTPTLGLRLYRDEGGAILMGIGNKLAPYRATDSQVEVDLAHMNAALEAGEKSTESKQRESRPGMDPTPGLRVEVDKSHSHGMGGGIDTVVFAIRPYDAYGPSAAQAKIDAAYINWLVQTDELRRKHLATLHAGGQEILVDLGDMTRVNLDIALDADYESMTEDIIQTFNHIVLQGIEPIKAVFSLSQAFAIVLGFALRANMPFEIAKALITQVMNSATASEKMVRIVTKQ